MPAGNPLSGTADAMLARLARATGSAEIAALAGGDLLGERAALMGSAIPGAVSAGGACRLLPARGDMIALNLARPDDRASLPALFEEDMLDPANDTGIAACVARSDAAALTARGRMLGLAIAAVHESQASGPQPTVALTAGSPAPSTRRTRPRVLDLSALWAGPLAAHLLWLAGAEVIKVESRNRPDAMRDGQPAFHALLNQGKASIVFDLRDGTDREALLDLIGGADIVIEAARPRALAQLGIDAARIVAARPGLIWLTITAHGAVGEAANWIGFGDDIGVAGGLSAALLFASGRIGFVGDAIADPLTGIHAALAGWEAWKIGHGSRIGVAMRDVVAHCLAAERARDPIRLARSLVDWADAGGRPFPAVAHRAALPAHPLGSGVPRWRDRPC
jgi:hypothetical protein